MKTSLLALTFLCITTELLAQTSVQEWATRYNNPNANGTEVWLDMVVDATGNSYGCGYGDGQGTGEFGV
jgi:hypothetical protein